MWFQDARNLQILLLSLFLMLGIGTRDWTLRWDVMLVGVVCCLLTQWLVTALIPYLQFKRRRLPLIREGKLLNPFSWEALLSLRSAMITALGLCLLLRANDYSTMAIAATLAILSKFLFHYRGKHFFNPANFGIIVALLFTSDAWISPGQWGADWWYLLLFIGTGGMILQRVGRWDTSAAFLVSYISFEALRHFWLGWSWDVLQHQLMSGSLLLFTFFMITDPRSIPNARISRLIWAVSLAWVTFILRDYFYVSTAVFWALFALSPLTIVLDSIWTAPRFQWKPKSKELVLGGQN